MNKKLIAIIGSSAIVAALSLSGIASTDVVQTVSEQTELNIAETANDTASNNPPKHFGRFDSSSWTDAQKTLLETAMKRDNDEATRKAALDQLVAASLISQEQADRMLQGPGEGKDRMMVDTSTWTDAQKTLLETAMKHDNGESTRKAALDQLVAASLISQEQADRMLTPPAKPEEKANAVSSSSSSEN